MKKLLLLLPILLYGQVIDTVIPLFDLPRERFLYISDGNKLYVNLDQSGRLLVLDCSTYAIRKIIQLPPNFPCEANGIWNQRRNKIYYSFQIRPESTAVIDNRTDSIIKWINFQSLPPPVYDSKDDKLYLSNGSLAVIDCETDSIIKIFPPQPYNLCVLVWDSIGNKLYCGELPNKVIVINCANDSVIAVINTGVNGPVGAVYNGRRRKVYVGNEQGHTGAVICAKGDTLIKNLYPITFQWTGQSLICNELEDKVYWPGWNGLYIIDCRADSIVKILNLPFILDGLRLDHLNNRLYVVTQDTASPSYDDIYMVIKFLDCYNDSVVSQIRFGRLGDGMEYDPRNQRIYIGDLMDSALYVIRTEIQGIEERSTLNAERFTPEVYPNPAKSYLAVRLPYSADCQMIKIFDVSGKMIREIASPPKADRNDGEMKISLKGINHGIYFLRLGKETKKFLIVR